MSEFCSVLNQKRASLLSFGYLRRKQREYNLPIPNDLCGVFLLFYHDVIEWQFKDKQLSKFYDCQKRWLFQGNKFKINNISFKLTICPRYKGWTFQSDGEYVALFFELDKKLFASNIDHILVYFILYFEEFEYEYRHIAKLSKINHDIMWYTPTVQYKCVKDKGFNQLSFGCYAEILRINYNENIDIDDDAEDEDIDIMPYLKQKKTIKYFTMNIKLFSRYKFEWALNKNELHRFKNAAMDYSLYSQNFNGGCFCIVCSPNGLSVIKQSEGLIFLKIKLLKLPCDVGRIYCQCHLILESIDPPNKFIHQEGREFAYNKTGDNIKDDLMKLPILMDVAAIKITAIIKIIQVFDSDDIQIMQSNWKDHGICDISKGYKDL